VGISKRRRISSQSRYDSGVDNQGRTLASIGEQARKSLQGLCQFCQCAALGFPRMRSRAFRMLELLFVDLCGLLFYIFLEGVQPGWSTLQERLLASG
jgi:hypothetical protein